MAAVERNDDNIESWRLLCALRSDAATLDARIFDLALLTVWKKIREIEVVLIFWLNIFILTYKIVLISGEHKLIDVGHQLTVLFCFSWM